MFVAPCLNTVSALSLFLDVLFLVVLSPASRRRSQEQRVLLYHNNRDRGGGSLETAGGPYVTPSVPAGPSGGRRRSEEGHRGGGGGGGGHDTSIGVFESGLETHYPQTHRTALTPAQIPTQTPPAPAAKPRSNTLRTTCCCRS